MDHDVELGCISVSEVSRGIHRVCFNLRLLGWRNFPSGLTSEGAVKIYWWAFASQARLPR
jgi:hypothetical protein